MDKWKPAVWFWRMSDGYVAYERGQTLIRATAGKFRDYAVMPVSDYRKLLRLARKAQRSSQ